jgi:hypothetical protein
VQAILRQLPPAADDFVRIPFPRIADGPGASAAVAAATRQYTKEAKVVDTRLFRQVTLALKGVSLADFCAALQERTGVTLHASRAVADEKVTVFVKEQRARDVMRAVARLFGIHWERAGEEGTYRYELMQDLQSRLAEEELRNRDADAAVLAMDARMEQFRPYLAMSVEEMQRRSAENRQTYLLLFDVLYNTGWGGMQVYHHLTPANRAALMAGEELVFRPDAPNPDQRLPEEWQRPILQSSVSHIRIHDVSVPMAEVQGIRINQVRLKLNRSEVGQATLVVRIAASWKNERGLTASTFHDVELATGRSPSVANPDNARVNAALRHQPLFDRAVTLQPEVTCPSLKGLRPDKEMAQFHSLSLGSPSFREPHVFSAEVWEVVHRETGLPIVADYFTRMHRLDKVSVIEKPLFDALCTVSDGLGVRWTKDGDFLLCRSTSHLWDRLKEVPDRFLRQWITSRDANGGLPFAQFLQMAMQPDAQLDSEVEAEAIRHCLGLREWGHLTWRPTRARTRLLTTLTPEQMHRALEYTGLPYRELTPEQQQDCLQAELEVQKAVERQGGNTFTPITAELLDTAAIYAEYIPADWYAWMPPRVPIHRPSDGPSSPVGGRTAEAALAAVRRVFPEATPEQVQYLENGHFSTGIRIFGRAK